MKPGKELLFLALGGSGEIGMNVNLYGCNGKWLMVDLGMTFADPYYPGVDLVFADLSFIEERRDDLLGVVLTHAHEDHIGAVPYFALDLGVPLYATPFTARLVQEKLNEAGIAKEVTLNVVPNDSSLSIGPFDIRYVPLAHSIAEGNALVIETPHGRVFHTGDWKLDDEPLIGVPATEAELTALGDEGVLALVCDSTNVFNPKPSGSEGAVRDGLMEMVAGLKSKRVVVTTFASNVARLQTLAEVAVATGRQLCVAGRSLDRIIGVAQASGYLKDFPEIVRMDAAMDLPRVSGHPGRPELAALYSWIKPEILVPVHGEMRHMAEQARLGKAEGIKRTIVQKNGDVVRLAPDGPAKIAAVRAGRLVLDGDIIAPADGGTMGQRRKLAESGVVVAALAVSPVGKLKSAIEIAAIGLPLEEDMDEFVTEAQGDVAKALGTLKGEKARNRAAIAEAVRLAVRRAAQRWSGKKPVVQVMLREG